MLVGFLSLFFFLFLINILLFEDVSKLDIIKLYVRNVNFNNVKKSF